MSWWERWREYCQSHLLVIVIWIGTLLVVNYTLLTKPIFYTHDFLHGARIAEMARGLREGQFPVIWSQNFGFGFGMPIFEFYAPLPYLVGAILYLCGLDLIGATKGIFIIANIGTMIGGFLWAREFSDDETASLAGAFLTLACYRATDLFARGAMSELWGIMGVVWLLAGITRLVRGRRYGSGVTVFGGCLVALSHNITLMLVAPVAVIYALVLLALEVRARELTWREVWCKGAGRDLITAAVAILGLTAFYWMPAILEKGLTQVDTYILSDYYDYHLHFLYLRQFWRDQFGYGGSSWGPDDGLSFFLGWAQWLGLVLSLGVAGQSARELWQARQQKKKNQEYRQKIYKLLIFTCILVLFVVTIFMSTGKSQFIWDQFAGLLAFAQFPWRWLGVSIVLLAPLSVWGVTGLPRGWRPTVIIALWLLLVITSSKYYVGGDYLEPSQECKPMNVPATDSELVTVCAESPGDGQTTFYIDDPDYIRETISPVLVDYLPEAFANYTVNDDGQPDWAHADTDTKILTEGDQPAVLVERMHEKLYDVTREASGEVELALTVYPGWRVEVDEQPVTYTTSPRGNLTLWLPAGTSRVGLYLDSTPIRRSANWISLFTLGWLAGAGIYQCQKNKP